MRDAMKQIIGGLGTPIVLTRHCNDIELVGCAVPCCAVLLYCSPFGRGVYGKPVDA